MKIWSIAIMDETLSIDELETAEKIEELIDLFCIGEKVIDWPGIELKTYLEGLYSDFANFIYGLPLFSQKVVEIFQPLIGEQVEFLPVTHPDHNFFICNILNIDDYIDHSLAIPKRIRILKLLQRYDNHVFKHKLLRGSAKRHIFRIPELPLKIFVSDEFVQTYLENDLNGLLFKLVYDSESRNAGDEKQIIAYQTYITERIEVDETYTWDQAMKLIEQGAAFASQHWKIQQTEDGDFMIGQLTRKLDYQFFVPTVTLKELHKLNWYKTSKSDI
ncbi:imm11 family protein [Paenibacillus wulumuqiensis]|uniref:imm11 family protein n=1 Tax=Paenibacillus wulumuqiensis TaxID=1567107 RepID=UPI0006191238|nr:hypothetical protein [Paenibacillus wulumuqiensis]